MCYILLLFLEPRAASAGHKPRTKNAFSPPDYTKALPAPSPQVDYVPLTCNFDRTTFQHTQQESGYRVDDVKGDSCTFLVSYALRSVYNSDVYHFSSSWLSISGVHGPIIFM